MVNKELSTVEFPVSARVKSQKIIYGSKKISKTETLSVFIKYDDGCNNGHNSFAITGEIRVRGWVRACGCLHEEIGNAFPELKKFMKWHLCSTDGPVHYIANTVYHLRNGNFEYAKNSAIWEDMPEHIRNFQENHIKKMLLERLPELMNDFKNDVESLGFKY